MKLYLVNRMHAGNYNDFLLFIFVCITFSVYVYIGMFKIIRFESVTGKKYFSQSFRIKIGPEKVPGNL